MVNVIVPDLGEGISKVEIAAWHAVVGDRVKRDEDLVEVSTDKAVFNIPAPADGVLRTIKAKAGDEIQIGGLLGEIEA